MPRSAIIWTRSRELSLNVRYHLTHRTIISWSKCRPLKSSCAAAGSVIQAVTAGSRAFQVCTRTVQNTETNDVQKITSEPNLDNFRIVELHPNADPKLFEAVISNGSQQGPVRFRF